MIYLSQSFEEVFSVLKMGFGSIGIRNTIELYLKSYKASFDFAQFYIQATTEYIPTAVVLRYNQSVYCLTDEASDISEISGFLAGLRDTEIVADTLLDLPANPQVCAVMCIDGSIIDSHKENISLITEPKFIASLVGESLSEDKRTDFFLNTAHQMRHNLLSVYGVLRDNELLSVASVSVNDNSEGIIPFVYTSQYFRGNGFSKSVLRELCNNPLVTYRLLCEEHNVEFYKKCGFSKESAWFKYNL